jgi:hypothetical protein
VNKPEFNQVKSAMQRLGYAVFDGGSPLKEYDLNIFGVRAKAPVVNTFCDYLGVFFRLSESSWEFHAWPASTDPGLYWLQNPMNVKGTAIVVPGQYRKSHQLGLHQGKYRALVQTGPIKVYRDNDKDRNLDMDPSKIDVGLFGINIHRASAYSKSVQVDKWSAGCQVFASPTDFAEFLDICNLAEETWGNSFTYTLLTEDQLGV